MELEIINDIRKNNLEPLANKDWLFPETGKAGFHYDDVSNAVIGLIEELRKIYHNEEEIVNRIEKWFPDITKRRQYPE